MIRENCHGGRVSRCVPNITKKVRRRRENPRADQSGQRLPAIQAVGFGEVPQSRRRAGEIEQTQEEIERENNHRMDSSQLNWIAGYIWGIADDVLRDLYVRGKYRDVILPMTVLRRLDAVLEPTKQAVLDMKESLDKAREARAGRPTKRMRSITFGTPCKVYTSFSFQHFLVHPETVLPSSKRDASIK